MITPVRKRMTAPYGNETNFSLMPETKRKYNVRLQKYHRKQILVTYTSDHFIQKEIKTHKKNPLSKSKIIHLVQQ
jgi:hypothetical protein